MMHQTFALHAAIVEVLLTAGPRPLSWLHTSSYDGKDDDDQTMITCA